MQVRKPITTKVLIGFEDDQLRMIDEWRRKQSDRPTRSVAVQRLVAQSLAASPPIWRTGKKAAAKASKMAALEVDRLADSSVPAEEQAKRKRRLLKGPSEFRDIRKDRPKSMA